MSLAMELFCCNWNEKQGLMLNGDKMSPKPKVVGFYTENDVAFEADHNLCSVNELSITVLDSRWETKAGKC